MYTNLYANNYTDEFPHTVEVLERKLVSSDYKNGDVYEWTPVDRLKVFMDTPSSSEILRFHQMEVTLDLSMYLPYMYKVNRLNRFRYEGQVYEAVSDLQDQGGQHEINRLLLRRLRDGAY